MLFMKIVKISVIVKYFFKEFVALTEGFLSHSSLDPQGRKIRVWPGLALFLGKFLENSHNLAGYSPVIKLVEGNSGVVKKREPDTYRVD